MLLVLLIVGISICTAEITNKQYASMPLLFHQDNFDQCMLLEDDALYCSFTYEIEPIDPQNTSETWQIINEVSSDEFNYRHDHLRHGICVPFTCPNMSYKNQADLREGIRDCYDKKFHNLGLKGTVTTIACETNEPKYPIDSVDILIGLLFICYIALVLFASFYEGVYLPRKSKGQYQKIMDTTYGKIMSSLSIYRNWERFVTIKTSAETEKLRCIQGIRFYNTFLVILCHTAVSFILGPVSNTKYVETVNDKFVNLFLSSGSLCVSTNFLMTSFLLCYGLLSQFENKKLELRHVIIIFINRYIRLTPTLFVVAMFNATWWRHLGRGPNWNTVIGREFLRCRKNWWTNILYINNFVDKENMCLPQTWYIALDTQYFIFLVLLVMFIKNFPKLKWQTLGFLLGLNMVGTFIQNYTNNFTAFLIPTPETIYDLKNILPHPQWHYQTTTAIGCTAGPVIGLGFGYLFYKYSKTNLFQKNRCFHEILHYVICYSGGLGIILIPGFLVMYLRVPHDIFWASVYNAINRPIFTLSIGYAIFTTIYGVGGITKRVLEWSPLYILGRLTYSAYLVHFSIVLYKPATERFPIFVDDISNFLGLLGNLSASFLLAFLLTLFLELPVSGLQKLFLTSRLKAVPKNKSEKKL